MDGSTHKAAGRRDLRSRAEKKTTSAEAKDISPRHYISPKRSQVIIASECPAIESDCGLPIPCPTMLFVLTMVLAMMFSLPLYASGGGTEAAGPTAQVAEIAGPAPMATTAVEAVKPAVAATRPVGIEAQPIRHTSTNAGMVVDTTKTEETKKPASGSTWAVSVQVFCALAVVIGLILLGRNLARKYIPGAATGSGKGVVEVLARHPLSRNQSLILVRIGSQIVALNQTKEASQSVLVISDQQEVANILGQIQGLKSTSIQKQFDGYLRTAERELEAGEDPDLLEAAKAVETHQLDEQLDEMAAARRQLMELRQQVRTVRENLK